MELSEETVDAKVFAGLGVTNDDPTGIDFTGPSTREVLVEAVWFNEEGNKLVGSDDGIGAER